MILEKQQWKEEKEILFLVLRMRGYRLIKRGFDVVAASALLCVLWPAIFAIAVAVKLDSKGPAFFVHTRIGMNRQPFKLYKFRTMVSNAEEIKASFSNEQLREWNENYKLVSDPRITHLGHFLRRSSLDELPQLFNVIRGDISLVGPRPVVEEELKKYGAFEQKFLSVIPGLTGYWQAYARNDCTYEKRIQMELYYIDHASFWFDLKILVKTVGRVLSQKGAM